MNLSKKVSLGDIARNIGGSVIGDSERMVGRLVLPKDADRESICILWDARIAETLPEGALVIAPSALFRTGFGGIALENAKSLLPVILRFFAGFLVRDDERRGIHPTAVVSPSASVHRDSWIGPFCSIDDDTVIEAGVRLLSHVSVGRACRVAVGAVIEPHVAVMDRCSIGRNVLIHGGTVIGADGFGFQPAPEGHAKIPQLGGVEIGAFVEIGACTTIDRGTIGDTVIGDGTKIDDHVHIAHNVEIGKNCIIVGMAGIAGSVVIEDGVVLAARSGIKDHVRIGRGAQVAGNAGVTKDVAPGMTVSGFPAREHRKTFRTYALMEKLPDLFDRVKRLERGTECVSDPSRTDLPEGERPGEEKDSGSRPGGKASTI